MAYGQSAQCHKAVTGRWVRVEMWRWGAGWLVSWLQGMWENEQPRQSRVPVSEVTAESVNSEEGGEGEQQQTSE